MYTIGLDQLQPIFQDPASIEAFELFHHALHRASDSLLTSLALLLQASLVVPPSQNEPYQSNPLYITLLIKRFLTHRAAAPALPPATHLPSLYFDFLLPVLFNLSRHPQANALSVQLVPCLAILARRLLKLPNAPDPLAKLIENLSTASITLHNQLHQPLEHFVSIKNSFIVVECVLQNLSQSNSAFSATLIRQVTKSHFNLLHTIYNRLFSIWTVTAAELQVATASSVGVLPADAQTHYAQLCTLLNSALGVLYHMLDALHTLSADILVQLTNELLLHFQATLDTRLALQPILGPGLDLHLKQYGKILLRIQICQPALIGQDVLQTYTLVLQHVHQRLVGPDVVETDTAAYAPLLVQAFRLLSSHLDCWHATKPLWELPPAEAKTLASLVQPFVHAPAKQDENSESVDGTNTNTDTESMYAEEKSNLSSSLKAEDVEDDSLIAAAIAEEGLVLLCSLKANFPQVLQDF